MKYILLLLCFIVAGCADTAKVTYHDGSVETFSNVTDFRCYPNNCSTGYAKTVGFCVGDDCILVPSFKQVVHYWYEPQGSINWYPYVRGDE